MIPSILCYVPPPVQLLGPKTPSQFSNPDERPSSFYTRLSICITVSTKFTISINRIFVIVIVIIVILVVLILVSSLFRRDHPFLVDGDLKTAFAEKR